MQRVTVIVSAELIEAANHVHVLLGKARGFNSYRAATWTDGANLYAVSSGQWSDAQIAGVTNPAVIAEMVAAGRVPEGVDLALASQAQAAFVFVDLASGTIPQAAPGQILAIASPDPQAALAQAGVQKSEQGAQIIP